MIHVQLIIKPTTSLANESEGQMNPDVSGYSCWIHCTLIQEEVALRPSHPGFRLTGWQMQWIVDCNLLVDLWSENDNELCQL